MDKIKKHHLEWQVDPSVLKDVRGVQKTRSLFLETLGYKQEGTYTPVYSLDNEDKYLPDGTLVPSAYLIYMASVDEYEAAIKLVGSLKHWRKLSSVEWFLKGEGTFFEGLEQWREDMLLRDQSKAKKLLQEAADSGNVNAQKEVLKWGSAQDKKKPGRKKREQPEDDRASLIEQLHSNVVKLSK